MEDKFNELISRLAKSTHSPSGEYTKERTWMLLQARMKGAVRPKRLRWLRKAAASVAVVCVAVLGWAMYNGVLLPQTVHTETAVEVPLETSDTHSSMTFDQTPLSDIAQAISENYHVRIVINDVTLRDYRVTATFAPEESLDDILDLLAKAANLTVERQDTLIIIK